MNKHILIDMDEILADLLHPWIEEYNGLYGDNLTIESIKTWDVHKYVKPECGHRIYDILKRPGFYKKLPEIPGAKEGVRQLLLLQNRVTVMSAAPNPVAAQDKLYWLTDHFPFINKEDIILGYKKHLIKADIFIDDGPHNIIAYRQHHPGSRILTIEYPWNREVRRFTDVCAADYQNTQSALDRIVQYIEEL